MDPVLVTLPVTLPKLPDGPHSLMGPGECDLLCWLAQQTVGNILEIGCHEGETTLALARTNPDKRVFAVDWPINDTLQPAQRHEIPGVHNVCHRARMEPNVWLTLADSGSLDWVSVFPGVGLVFIDGDHSYEGVKRDTAKAMKYFADTHRDGLIVWHDYYSDGYTRSWCGVKQLVDSIPWPKYRYGILCFAWAGNQSPLNHWFGLEEAA